MYDFDSVIERKISSCMKWSTSATRLTPEQLRCDPLPMWVADMDFRAAPEIQQAIQQRVDHGIYGYGTLPSDYAEAVCDWQQRRYGWRPDPATLVASSGIISALNAAIHAFTREGEGVLIMTPVYFHFHYDVEVNGRKVCAAPLNYRDKRYHYDREAFIAAIEPDTRLFILSNPHNPTGNVWTEAELRDMAEICISHNIVIVSDEIHSDFIFSSQVRHIPLASLGREIADNTIVCTSPSKTFNLAGLQCANIFIQNEQKRLSYREQCVKSGNNLVNVIGVEACKAACLEGESWMLAMLDYIGANRRYFYKMINGSGLPVHAIESDSLYLLWLDCSEMGLNQAQLFDFFITRCGIWLEPGSKFHSGGEQFMRINLGCPFSVVQDATRRILEAFHHEAPRQTLYQPTVN